MGSEERFGYQWEQYSGLDPSHEEQFAGWVAPLGKSDFAGKTVLDAGCGMGRNSYWSLKWGAKSVEAFDFDDRSVAAAASLLEEFPNARVFKRSVYDLSPENAFDLVISIGVVHHLEAPEIAVANLARAVKPDGKLVIWVYSRENNEWIVRLVDPVRKRITSRIPVRLTHLLAYGCSVPLWLYLRIARPKAPYLKQLSYYRLRHVHLIVFDQLIPKISHYWRRAEVEALLTSAGLSDFQLHRSGNQVGWTAIATKTT